MRLSYKSVIDRHIKRETNDSIAESLQITKKTVRRIIGKAEEPFAHIMDALLLHRECRGGIARDHHEIHRKPEECIAMLSSPA